MLQVNPEAIMVEGPGATSNKKNPFDLFASIFRKKASDSDTENTDASDETTENCNLDRPTVTGRGPVNTPSPVATRQHSADHPSPTISGGRPHSVTEATLSELSVAELLQRSPASAKLRNLQEDMEALHMSRQDNPYLQQQLERLSFQESDSSWYRSLDNSPKKHERPTFHSDMELDKKEKNLHQHLIRSPPPQFPQHVAHFMFLSRANSPKHKVSDIASLTDLTDETHKNSKKQKTLNPLLTKTGVDAMDPYVKEVLDYQKQKYVYDSIDVGKLNADGAANPQKLLPIATKPQARWSTTSGGRPLSLTASSPTLSTATGSLPGLNTYGLAAYSNGDVDTKSDHLGPLKGGRPHVDGFMTSSSVQDLPSTSSGLRAPGQPFGYMFPSCVTKTGSQEPLLNTSKASSLDSG